MKITVFYKYIFLLAFAGSLGLMGCEDLQPEREFVSGQFVTLSNISPSFAESGGSTILTITRRGVTDFSSTLDVPYTVSGVFANDNSAISDVSQYVMVTPSSGEAGRLVIPAGETSATITLTGIDNVDADGSKLITLTLTGSNVGFPGPGANNSVSVATIGDDDCAFDISTFAGDYSASDPNNPFGTEEYDVSITTDAATNQLTISGLGGLDGRSIVVDISSDITNPTVTIPDQPVSPTTTVNGGANVVGYGDDPTAPSLYVSCDGNMTLTVFLLAYDSTGSSILGAFNGGNSYTITLIKQ